MNKVLGHINDTLEELERLRNEIEYEIQKTEAEKKESKTGIICPKCKSMDSHVIGSRKNSKFLVRRRECCNCKYRWNTEEVMSLRACYDK